MTIGTFDMFHYGHLWLLQRAAGLGHLVVGVNSDRFVEEYKGRPPAICARQRLLIVAALKCVQAAVINDGPGFDLIRKVRPDMIVVGSDWHQKRYLAQLGITQEELDGRGIAVMYLPRTPGVSTSELRA